MLPAQEVETLQDDSEPAIQQARLHGQRAFLFGDAAAQLLADSDICIPQDLAKQFERLYPPGENTVASRFLTDARFDWVCPIRAALIAFYVKHHAQLKKYDNDSLQQQHFVTACRYGIVLGHRLKTACSEQEKFDLTQNMLSIFGNYLLAELVKNYSADSCITTCMIPIESMAIPSPVADTAEVFSAYSAPHSQKIFQQLAQFNRCDSSYLSDTKRIKQLANLLDSLSEKTITSIDCHERTAIFKVVCEAQITSDTLKYLEKPPTKQSFFKRMANGFLDQFCNWFIPNRLAWRKSQVQSYFATTLEKTKRSIFKVHQMTAPVSVRKTTHQQARKLQQTEQERAQEYKIQEEKSQHRNAHKILYKMVEQTDYQRLWLQISHFLQLECGSEKGAQENWFPLPETIANLFHKMLAQINNPNVLAENAAEQLFQLLLCMDQLYLETLAYQPAFAALRRVLQTAKLQLLARAIQLQLPPNNKLVMAEKIGRLKQLKFLNQLLICDTADSSKQVEELTNHFEILHKQQLATENTFDQYDSFQDQVSKQLAYEPEYIRRKELHRLYQMLNEMRSKLGSFYSKKKSFIENILSEIKKLLQTSEKTDIDHEPLAVIRRTFAFFVQEVTALRKHYKPDLSQFRSSRDYQPQLNQLISDLIKKLNATKQNMSDVPYFAYRKTVAVLTQKSKTDDPLAPVDLTSQPQLLGLKYISTDRSKQSKASGESDESVDQNSAEAEVDISPEKTETSFTGRGGKVLLLQNPQAGRYQFKELHSEEAQHWVLRTYSQLSSIYSNTKDPEFIVQDYLRESLTELACLFQGAAYSKHTVTLNGPMVLNCSDFSAPYITFPKFDTYSGRPNAAQSLMPDTSRFIDPDARMHFEFTTDKTGHHITKLSCDNQSYARILVLKDADPDLLIYKNTPKRTWIDPTKLQTLMLFAWAETVLNRSIIARPKKANAFLALREQLFAARESYIAYSKHRFTHFDTEPEISDGHFTQQRKIFTKIHTHIKDLLQDFTTNRQGLPFTANEWDVLRIIKRLKLSDANESHTQTATSGISTEVRLWEQELFGSSCDLLQKLSSFQFPSNLDLESFDRVWHLITSACDLRALDESGKPFPRHDLVIELMLWQKQHQQLHDSRLYQNVSAEIARQTSKFPQVLEEIQALFECAESDPAIQQKLFVFFHYFPLQIAKELIPLEAAMTLLEKKIKNWSQIPQREQQEIKQDFVQLELQISHLLEKYHILSASFNTNAQVPAQFIPLIEQAARARLEPVCQLQTTVNELRSSQPELSSACPCLPFDSPMSQINICEDPSDALCEDHDEDPSIANLDEPAAQARFGERVISPKKRKSSIAFSTVFELPQPIHGTAPVSIPVCSRR